MNYTGRELDDMLERHRAEGRRIAWQVLGIAILAGVVVGYMIRAGLTNIN